MTWGHVAHFSGIYHRSQLWLYLTPFYWLSGFITPPEITNSMVNTVEDLLWHSNYDSTRLLANSFEQWSLMLRNSWWTRHSVWDTLIIRHFSCAFCQGSFVLKQNLLKILALDLVLQYILWNNPASPCMFKMNPFIQHLWRHDHWAWSQSRWWNSWGSDLWPRLLAYGGLLAVSNKGTAGGENNYSLKSSHRPQHQHPTPFLWGRPSYQFHKNLPAHFDKRELLSFHV